MRALFNGESLLSHIGLPSKSLTQTSNKPFIQYRVYSKGKYPRHPTKDIIDAIKKAQEVEHLKNGTLFKTEMPQHLFEYQTIAFARPIGPDPPKKNSGRKADPPGFCDPPRKGAPCLLLPEYSNEVLQPASNKGEKSKPSAKKTTPSGPRKPELPKAPKKKANENRLANKLSTDKKKPLKKPSKHGTNMVAHKSNPFTKREPPKAPKKNINAKGLEPDKMGPLKSSLQNKTNKFAKSNPPGRPESPKQAKKEANGKAIQHDKICPLKSPSLQDMKMVADKSNPPGKPQPPKAVKKESSGKDKMVLPKSPSQNDTSIVAGKSNPPGKAEPPKTVKKESSGRDKMGPLKSSSQHDMKSASSKSQAANTSDADQIKSGLRKPPMESEKAASKKVESSNAKPMPIIPGFPAGKFPCLDKNTAKKQESDDDSKSFNKGGKKAEKKGEESPEGDKCDDLKSYKKDQNNDELMTKSNGKKSTDSSCNKSKDHNQSKESKKRRLEHTIDDECRKLKQFAKKYEEDMEPSTNDSNLKSEKMKYPPIPPKQTADGKIFRSPIVEKAKGKLKEVQNASDSTSVCSGNHQEGQESIKKPLPNSEAAVHKTCDSTKPALEDPNSKAKTADCSAKSSKPSINSSKETKETETREDNARQNLLPYPVTPLKETLDRYLCSVKPLLEDDLFNLEQQLVKEFLDKDGAKLQAFLEKEANGKANWLTERWTNAAYLEVRTPLTIYTSPCLAFPLQKFLHPIDYITFVAKCIYGMLEFKKMVDDNKIPVVKMCQYELDNSQFGKIFGGVRVPMPCMDAIEQYNDSDYVIVINKNNFYKLPVYNGDGKIVHAHALRDQLDGIVNGPSERGDTMGLLTHDTRDNWAEVHELLMHDQDNCHILDVIEKALFAVCLDEYVDLPPEGEQRNLQAAHLLHGGGRHLNSANRWMDKTLQLIVNPNGFSGICFEHSPADCQPLAMLMDLLQKNIRQPGYGCESCNDGKVEPFTPLIFKPLNQCTELWMSVAERNIDDLCKHFQLNVFKFHCHGKNFIMAQGLNTDSYIQIALQLAFFLMHKEMPSQYESAHLRIFEGGRTETIRSTTIESSAFIKSMTLPTTSKKDRMEALRAAVDAHQELTKLALLGRGVDRHLFGLQQMAKENGLPLPEFFKSPAYLKSINYRVLSSQVATSHDAFLAFGPLTPCGYGCCYNPRNNDIIFSISNWNTHKKTSAEIYGQAINTALHHMRKLVLETGGDRGSIELCKCDGKSDKK